MKVKPTISISVFIIVSALACWLTLRERLPERPQNIPTPTHDREQITRYLDATITRPTSSRVDVLGGDDGISHSVKKRNVTHRPTAFDNKARLDAQPTRITLSYLEDSTVMMPAAWIDMKEVSTLTEEQQNYIQYLAEDLRNNILESGLAPGSQDYLSYWNKAVLESDRLFRLKFGSRAWIAHHIEAFHMHHTSLQGAALIPQ